MAYYYKKIAPTDIDDNSPDVTQHIYPFISAEMRNWASLCGPHVDVRVDSTNYTGSRTSTADRPIVLELKSDAQVSGIDTGENMGLSWEFDNYYRVYNFFNHTISSSNSGEGTFGSRPVNYVYASNYNFHSSSMYNQGYTVEVIYCDDPGNRFFACFPFVGKDQIGYFSFCVTEIQGRANIDPLQNGQWAYMRLYQQECYPIVRAGSELKNINPYAYASSVNEMVPTFETGGYNLLKNIPVHSGQGLYLGHLTEDNVLYNYTVFSRPVFIEYQGKTYYNPHGHFFFRVN